MYGYTHPHADPVTVLYEPRFNRVPHARLGTRCIRSRSENLTPDVVVVVRDQKILFEAKLSANISESQLAEATLKYIHGLHQSRYKVQGLHLLFYNATSEVKDYQIEPAEINISSLPVHPDNRDHIVEIIRQYIQI